MNKRKHDPAVWFGIAVFGLALLLFFAVVKCRPDFFRDVTLMP